jgi:putative membrane protein
MRLAARIALLAGLALLIGLIAHEGGSILTPIMRAGWVLLWLLPLHTVPLVLDSRGWQALLERKVHAARLLWIACVRESINRLLPVANIGGELVGIRLLAASGTEGIAAAASVTAETLLSLFSQYLFVALGVACLLRVTHTVHSVTEALIGLGSSLPVIVLAWALLRYGSLFERLEKLAVRMLGEETLSFLNGKSASLDAAIRTLIARPARLIETLGWQFAGLLASAIEPWLALRWLGHPVGFGAALALESLAQAARNFIFVVPGGIGVQEATLVGVGALLGINGDMALALSLTKRMREILFGTPALLSWYWMEGKKELQHVRGSGRY